MDVALTCVRTTRAGEATIAAFCVLLKITAYPNEPTVALEALGGLVAESLPTRLGDDCRNLVVERVFRPSPALTLALECCPDDRFLLRLRERLETIGGKAHPPASSEPKCGAAPAASCRASS